MSEVNSEIAAIPNTPSAADISKILSEKHKIVSEKKRFIIDGLKLLIWLYATCIAVNYISLNTEKIFGLLPFEHKFLGLYATNIICFAFGIIRITLFIFDASFDNALKLDLPEQQCDTEEEWTRLSCEFRLSIENDIKIINTGKSLLYWALKWLASGFGLSLLPIGIEVYYKYFP